MPERAIIWSEDAEEDLISIWRFGADEWSPATAGEHLADIQHTCDLLLEEPELGRPRDELMRGIRSIPLDPHIIFYRIAKQRSIEVVRVLHQREDTSDIFQ